MALVLKRNPGERIRIADDIVITVVNICGKGVSLSVEAPRDVPVDRDEVYLSKIRQGLRIHNPALQPA